MEIYGFAFSPIELISLSVLFAAFLYELYFYLRYINGVLRLRTGVKKNKVFFLPEQPPVSVIICAKDEADNLRKFLPLVLQQDYPDFEVIVINDGSTDETEILLRDLLAEYKNLRTTFVPVGTSNLSTKKLGLTLGIKAAKNELLLFTDADCMPGDKMWIARMVRNFTPETEFVLGYGAYFPKQGFLNRLITYDTLFSGLQYLGMAIAHKPYMGVGRNLAYRKGTFFAQKGFAGSLHLSSGDDDLMVNRAATAQNTRVEVAPDSVTWSEPNISFREWLYQKQRHLSVSPYYRSSSKMRLLIEPLMRGIFYASLIVSLIVGNVLVIIVSLLFFLTRFIVQAAVINNSARHFGDRKHFFLILPFDIYLPLLSLYLMMFSHATGRQKMYWK